MKNKYSNLTNEELFNKVQENTKENDLILQEIFDRKDDGRMKKGKVIKGSLIEYFQNKKKSA